MLTDEQKSRLNPEQLAIAERWEKEREDMGKVFEKLHAAMEAKDETLWHEALAEATEENIPSMCEHERSIWSPCAACDEIEQLLNPEFYDVDGERLPDEEIEKLINGRG